MSDVHRHDAAARRRRPPCMRHQHRHKLDSSCLSGWWRGLIYLSGCSRCVKEPRVEGRHVEAGGDGRHHLRRRGRLWAARRAGHGRRRKQRTQKRHVPCLRSLRKRRSPYEMGRSRSSSAIFFWRCAAARARGCACACACAARRGKRQRQRQKKILPLWLRGHWTFGVSCKKRKSAAISGAGNRTAASRVAWSGWA